MRRPVLYLAGLLLATGASFAFAGPAAAADRHDWPHGHHHHFYGHHHHWWFNGDCDGNNGHDRNYLNGNHLNGINILNGVLNGSGGLGLL